MTRLIEMETFAAVVEQGGFTVAARKLGISKSAVSKHIANLEGRLGARLLSRSTRRVHPTDIGLAYYDRASRILNDAGEADALVASMQVEPTGVLRMSVATDFGVSRLCPLIGKFLDGHPGLSVNIVLQNRFAELNSQGFDMSVRVGDVEDDNLQTEKIATAEKRLVASPTYLARFGHPETIDELKDHRLLHYSNRPSCHVWTLTNAKGCTHPLRAAGWLSINDGQSLTNAACAGLGIAQLPSYLYEDAMRAGQLVDAMPTLRPEKLSIHAVHPAGRITQPKVRSFIDFLIKEFEQKQIRSN